MLSVNLTHTPTLCANWRLLLLFSSMLSEMEIVLHFQRGAFDPFFENSLNTEILEASQLLCLMNIFLLNIFFAFHALFFCILAESIIILIL